MMKRIEKADVAEQRVIEQVRKIGHVALSEWAECKNKRNETELKKLPELRIAGKKLWRHSTFDVAEIEETLFRNNTRIVRTFSDQAGAIGFWSQSIFDNSWLFAMLSV